MPKQTSPSTAPREYEGIKINPEVAVQYELAPGVLSRFVCAEFGDVDMSAVNLEFAKRLAEAGYLIEKSTS